jgi:AraC family transcriptional regulator
MALQRARTDFWGEGPPWREADRFSFHHLAADAPEEEVEQHVHAEAHFVLILSGGYMSSAAGAPIVSATPILIHNPPGTEHRDRFHGGRGRFLAVSGGMAGEEGAPTCLRDPYALWTARSIVGDLHAASGLSLAGRAWQLHAAVVRPSSDESVRAADPPG